MANPGFAQIIHRRPHKIPDEVRKHFNPRPVLENIFRIRFRPHHHPLWVACMIGFIFIQQVIIPCDIQMAKCRIGKSIPVFSHLAPIGADGLSDGASGIVQKNLFAQMHPRLRITELLRNFISNRPHDDRWMIAVTPHHRGNVALRPVLEKAVIVLRVIFFGNIPLIKSFINYQHA